MTIAAIDRLIALLLEGDAIGQDLDRFGRRQRTTAGGAEDDGEHLHAVDGAEQQDDQDDGLRASAG